MKWLVCGEVALVTMTVLTSWRKYLSMNKNLLFFMMVSNNIPIVWVFGAPGSRVLACNFM